MAKNHCEIFFCLLNHSGNFFFKRLMIKVASKPPTMLIMYFISSSNEPKEPESMLSKPKAAPAVAAVPKMKFKKGCTIILRFKV